MIAGFLYSLAGFFVGSLAGLGISLWIEYRRFIGSLRNGGILPKLFIWTNLFSMIPWPEYFECGLRASLGRTLERPFGTYRHLSPWNQLVWNPVYLTRRPLNLEEAIDTEVILGPRAHKPLRLKIPIMFGGMSYGGALSLSAKISLAKAATRAGTATSSGSGTFLDEERAYAERYILQYSRGFWTKAEEFLKQADMIEIGLGHGAWGSAPIRILGNKVNSEFARRTGSVPGWDVLIETRLPEVETAADWRRLICRLKKVSGGVPVAVKFGATQFLEAELDRMIAGGIDVIILDGMEGGTQACPSLIADDTGLPTMAALCRAAAYIRENRLAGKVSLVVGGGLVTPSQFLKCMALGADAVIIGTVAVLVMVHTQVTKGIPWEPLTSIIYHQALYEHEFDPDLAAKHLTNFFQSSVLEMKQLARGMGRSSLKAVDRTDLAALDPFYAAMTGVEYLGNPEDSWN